MIEANRNNRDGFISIDALAWKYQMDNWHAPNLILEPHKFDFHNPQYCFFNGMKYLMTYSYLISNLKAEELRKAFLSLPTIINNNTNNKLISAKYASSLLKKEDIPENQHPNIISKLGFDIFDVMQDEGLRRYIGGTLNDAVIKEKEFLVRLDKIKR